MISWCLILGASVANKPSFKTLSTQLIPSSLEAILNFLFLSTVPCSHQFCNCVSEMPLRFKATQKAFLSWWSDQGLPGQCAQGLQARQGTWMSRGSCWLLIPAACVPAEICFYAATCNFSKDTANRDVYAKSPKFIYADSFLYKNCEWCSLC